MTPLQISTVAFLILVAGLVVLYLFGLRRQGGIKGHTTDQSNNS